MKHRCPCCNHEFSDPEPPAGLARVQARALRAKVLEAMTQMASLGTALDHAIEGVKL